MLGRCDRLTIPFSWCVVAGTGQQMAAVMHKPPELTDTRQTNLFFLQESLLAATLSMQSVAVQDEMGKGLLRAHDVLPFPPDLREARGIAAV